MLPVKESCYMLDKLKWVREWFRKGENDLIAAQMIIKNLEPPTDTICFHAQQCAEKYLKGYLTLHNVEVGKTHDLVNLNNCCRGVDSDFEILAEACEKLTGYAVEVRYPGDFCDYTLEESGEAIALAKKVRDFILERADLSSPIG